MPIMRSRWPDRRFHQSAVDRAWVADITHALTGEGWIYLAAVHDLWSRWIVNWSMAQSMSRKGNCWDTQSKIELNAGPRLTHVGIGPLLLR
jgi:transposase InsO family protein